MTLIKKVNNTIIKNKLFKSNNYLLLMVSGGSDSTALAYIMTELAKCNFAIMHLDHNLRDNSKEDAEFVKSLAEYLNVPYLGYNKKIKEIAKDNKANIEACAREIRYQCANDAIGRLTEKYKIKPNTIRICTAHTADDRIENFYMRSIVGTGPAGLISMRYKNGNIVRPLLDIPKDALIQYINNIKKPYKDKDGNLWKEDETNLDSTRFRAYVRHNIIPLAKRQNPNIIQNLCNSMNLIADESDFLEEQVAEVTEKHIDFYKESFFIKPSFNEESIVLKRRAIYNALIKIYKPGTRIETKTIVSVLKSIEEPGYTDNIQQNYAVHSNKRGSLIQPMKYYRKNRKRI